MSNKELTVREQKERDLLQILQDFSEQEDPSGSYDQRIIRDNDFGALVDAMLNYEERRDKVLFEGREITYNDIAFLLPSMSKDQLNQPIIFWGDGIGGKFNKVFVLGEDHINPSGDGNEPISTYKDEPETIEGEPVTLRKGTIILQLDQ